MKLNVLAAALLLASTLPCLAQTAAPAKRPMTFADLQAIKRIADPQVSPSGKWVMFSVTEVSLEKNAKTTHLWVVPVDGGKEVQITFGDIGDNQTNGRFSPDGKQISLTATDPATGLSQIWLAPWIKTSGTIGRAHVLTRLSTEADGAIWSPDSQRLMFVSSVYPECSDKPAWGDEEACNKAKIDDAAKNPVKAQVFDHLLYRHWNAFTGERRSHVLVVAAADGEQVRDLTPRSAVGDAETPTFSLGGPLGYAWAPDAKEIAYVTNLDEVKAASTNNDVFTLRLDEPGANAVKVSTSLGSDDGPQYSPDGKYLAFRSQARAGYESDRFRLMVLDRKTKATREVIKKFDLWVDEFLWAPDASRIYFASGAQGREPVYSVALSGPSAGQVAGLVQSGEFGSLSLTPDGKVLVMTGMTAESPATVLAMHTAIPDEKFTLVTQLNDGLLATIDLSAMEAFTFKGAANADIQGFIVRPPNFDPSKKYPVKFLIHGGPQGAWGDAWSYRWNPELFAANGYVVVMVNPRGSTGYGQAFIDGVNGDWGGKAYVDLMKGLDAAEAKYPFIDKTRECALGASYGGFMANWILTHTDRFKCIVSHDGMYNPAAAYGDTEELWFNEWEFRRRMPDGSLDTKPAQPWRYQSLPASEDPFRKWSPMLNIANAKTPTLVIHSQKDYRLDVSEGFQLFTALQREGVPSKMLYFPDEGHWVLKPKNSELWYQTVNDWCDRWTKSGKYAGK